MLSNPKWENPSQKPSNNPTWGNRSKQPSIAGFKAWLQTKNPEETFYYQHGGACAVGQYLASIGMGWGEYFSIAHDLNYDLNCFSFELGTDHPTFGSVLRRIEVHQNEV